MYNLKAMEWEKQYLEALMRSLRPGGDVLQVGYGDGRAAAEIQKYHPASHTILEREEKAAQKARKWARKRIKAFPNVKIIEAAWEDELSQLGVFDAVFFNEPEQPLPEQRLFAGEVVQEGNQLLEEIGRQFPHLAKIRYSDLELEKFCETVRPSLKGALSRFLADLERNGQISGEQRKKAVKKYKLPDEAQVRAEPLFDPMGLFLKVCLKSHMRKGSRFSCFSTAASKYEDSFFSSEIAVDPHLNVRETVFTAQKKEAFIFIVEKLV